MKRKQCSYWNRIDVEKIFLKPECEEPKVQGEIQCSCLPRETE